ncbi:FMN reductase [Motilibacter rhizosphaerae]|uniref:FMN reductase n=1 Tax=Motilibacter rhizosphaerae TaxID=598652 RepID=A0A4Q7NFX9_9ACTN|nr:NAD(P)H-dependent oxidoreductase [Motilibacter rhizosphaerae]RZS82801.1 FMN reductase [Motilibacter rhizosphaerae]
MSAPGRPGVVTVSGNPRPGSRTTRLAVALGDALQEALRLPGAAQHLELATLPAPFGADAGAALAEPLAALRSARVAVIATPTYKASYTGLLKAFVDLLPPAALAGMLAVPVLTLGAPGHTLAAEVHLRPLLHELGATTPTAAVTVLDAELADPEAAGRAWAERLVPSLRPLVTEGVPA